MDNLGQILIIQGKLEEVQDLLKEPRVSNEKVLQ